MNLSKSKIHIGIPSPIAFLLVLLFLMSPCAIRNSVENALGLKIQKSLNANKVSFQQNYRCSVYPISQVAHEIEKGLKPFKLSQVHSYISIFLIPVAERVSFRISLYNNLLTKTIPLYILFKKWKCFI